MMHSLRISLRSLLLTGLAVSTASAADVNDFIDFSIADLPGRLFVPPEAQDSPRPVIVFLHGAGETGTDNLAQIGGNIDNLLAEAKDRGAFLYAPQATTVVGSIFNWGNIARTEAVVDQLDQILANQNTEPSRVYLTGLSMGGGGTWNMTSRNPDRFAAALPIAGVTVANDYVPANQLGTPTWAFHARDDGVVSNQNSRDVVSDIVLAAGEPAVSFPRRETGNNFEYVNDDIGLRYTEFPTGGHAIWPQVYNTPEVYDWMFSFTTIPEPSTACLALLTLAVGQLSRRRHRS